MTGDRGWCTYCDGQEFLGAQSIIVVHPVRYPSYLRSTATVSSVTSPAFLRFGFIATWFDFWTAPWNDLDLQQKLELLRGQLKG